MIECDRSARRVRHVNVHNGQRQLDRDPLSGWLLEEGAKIRVRHIVPGPSIHDDDAEWWCCNHGARRRLGRGLGLSRQVNSECDRAALSRHELAQAPCERKAYHNVVWGGDGIARQDGLGDIREVYRTRHGGNGSVVDPERLAQLARDLAAAGAIANQIGGMSRDEDVQHERLELAIKTCTERPKIYRLGLIDGRDPCSVGVLMYLPSETDTGEAAVHRGDATEKDPLKYVQTYEPSSEAKERVRAELAALGLPTSNPRRWHRHYDPCNIDYNGNVLNCDEFPNFAMANSGPPGTPSPGTLGSTSLKMMSASDNQAEGNRYSQFIKSCPAVRARKPFLVVPIVEPIVPVPTFWICYPS